jgi:hypothetical protein
VALSVLDVPPLDPEDDQVLLSRLAELALVVAVFSAGLTIERNVERRSWVSTTTLLVVVMPLTILAIALFGMWAMGLSFGAALLLGAVLAPTDPVLAGGQTHRRAPARRDPRGAGPCGEGELRGPLRGARSQHPSLRALVERGAHDDTLSAWTSESRGTPESTNTSATRVAPGCADQGSV